MKRFLGIILILLTICVFVNCKQPVGSITKEEGGGGSFDLDFLWLVPARFLYDTEQWYIPENDLQIMYAGDGNIKVISAKDVKIEILEHADSVDDPNIIKIENGQTKLVTAGRHRVRVTYNERKAYYTIEVRGTYSGGGDDSDLFEVIWL